MKGTLYQLTNIYNNKSYIGKTYQTLSDRLKQHRVEANSNRSKDRKLYKAVRKYGFNAFKVTVLGEYLEGDLEEQEIIFIELYDTFNTGYNSTKGGDGTRYLKVSEDAVIKAYTNLKSIVGTANLLKISSESVKLILQKNNVKTLSSAEVLRARGERILIVDINEEFNNAQECAQFLIDSEVVDITSIENIVRSIRRVAEGSRASYKKLKFQYI